MGSGHHLNEEPKSPPLRSAAAIAHMQAYPRTDPQGEFAAKIKTIIQQMESSGALRASPLHNAQPPPV